MKMDLATATDQARVERDINAAALFACSRAKALEEAGEFDAARQALNLYWQRIGDRPSVEGMDAAASAELLLRAGTLSGWIGSARQIPGAQESAKDLISEATRMFAELGLTERVAEGHVDLAICYWREGSFNEAGVTLDQALAELGDLQSEQRLRALLNKANVERATKRYDDALKTHQIAAPLFDVSNNNALRGKFHNEYASVLKNLGLARNREDLIDRALVEYSAASFHAELAGNKRFLALVENNVGFLFVQLERFREAKTHLDRARSLFTGLKDRGMVAQVDDSLARALIGRGRYSRAEALARTAVSVLEEGDELSVLADALTTYGTALARNGNHLRARATFEKAIRTAQNAGDIETAGVAALALTEELLTRLPFDELIQYFRMAESDLQNSQRPGIEQHLGRCARAIMKSGSVTASATTAGSNNASSAAPVSADGHGPANASLDAQVLQYEADLIKQALEAADGSITRAARKLGITHQGLAFILNGRQKNLLAARKPAKPRRRSIIRHH